MFPPVIGTGEHNKNNINNASFGKSANIAKRKCSF